MQRRSHRAHECGRVPRAKSAEQHPERHQERWSLPASQLARSERERHGRIPLIGNLVSNALVYGKAETPITVTSKVDEASFSVAVHNDGLPIPAATQHRPMTRGAKAINSGRSVGLGLFIVREIARAHGGNAVVESREGEGTTFTATFPRR